MLSALCPIMQRKGLVTGDPIVVIRMCGGIEVCEDVVYVGIYTLTKILMAYSWIHRL